MFTTVKIAAGIVVGTIVGLIVPVSIVVATAAVVTAELADIYRPEIEGMFK